MNNAYRLAYKDGYIYVQGGAKHLVALRRIPGTQSISDPGAPGGCVCVPASRAAFLAVEALASPVSVSDQYEVARNYAMSVEFMRYIGHADDLELAFRLLPGLLEHQATFCALAYNQRGMLNASEPGTGKTRTGWACTYLWKAQRALIVCPKSLIPTWRREWELLWNEGERPFGLSTLDSDTVNNRAVRLRGLGNSPDSWPVAACINYEVLHDLRDALFAYNPDCIIIDECFRVANPEAQVTKALTGICDRAKHVLLLTGTPYTNKGAAGLYSQLRMLGKDVIPETYWQWTSAYCELELMQLGARQIWDAKGCRDPIGLMQRIEPVYFRVTKETCLQLPPKSFEVVKLKMSPEQEQLYRAVKKDGGTVLGDPLNLDGARVNDIRLAQIAGGHQPDLENNCVWPLNPCPKIEWIKQWAEDTLKDTPSARAIVWIRFNHEGMRILNELSVALGSNRVRFVWGETNNLDLEIVKDSFNSRSEDGIQVIVAQVKKLAYGHNLQSCDYNIYFSLPWSFVEYSQSQDRSHRMGREGGVSYTHLLCENTIDEEVYSALQKHEDFSMRMAPATSGCLK